jgi:8-oxo-dGTP diphosphatase
MTTQYDNTSVTAFIIWEGKALLVQRADNEDFLPSYWEQVGGKVEPGESQEEAVIREVKEEAGINVVPIRSYNQFEYTHRDSRFMCEYAYICEIIGGPTVKLSNEHQNYKWVNTKELESISPMTDIMRDVVTKGFAEST